MRALCACLVILGTSGCGGAGALDMMFLGGGTDPQSEYVQPEPRVFPASIDRVGSEVILALSLVGAAVDRTERREDGSMQIVSRPITARRSDGLDCGRDPSKVGSGRADEYIAGEVVVEFTLRSVDAGTRADVSEGGSPGCITTGVIGTRVLDEVGRVLGGLPFNEE